MKGQSAVEYLTTYSWMILAVAVVAGVAYTNIENSCTTSSSDFYTDSMAINGFGVDNSDNFVLDIQNTRYQDIRFNKINITVNDRTENKTLGYNLSSSQSTEISMSGFETGTGCNTLEINIDYDLGRLQGQQATGIIRAPISFKNT
ncbi:hypothetical protein [Candidatus Nanohalobium constans]|uniref:Uncharacterized protein n=1 Tax=Candidatus Nanohalobium constans TaxID=2565781 RepID=A0A5Q0UHD8_9ARCH|nr:hypothetical protein [Candidatus Nanohalobium constans]QGA80996.1 hypothetical protein LC1Nh_1128 [Candidatus Nanohalobium constans]